MANINILKNGPYQIQGDLKIKDGDGNPIDCSDKVFLCRCGQTSNTPFCDGAHKTAEFKG